MTSSHLTLLYFCFGKTIINLNTIGRSATSEDLGICLLIRLFQALVFGVSWMPCCILNADVARSVCLVCSLGLLALLVLLVLRLLSL